MPTRRNLLGEHFRMPIAAILACVFCAGVARGQGTSDLLPGPISTTRVLQYAEGLDLDGAQRDALLASHEVYLDQFLQLRETRIRRFLETAEAVRAKSLPSVLPDRDELHAYLAEHARISSMIARIETQMFDLLEADLRDDQRPGLESIRLGRERERLNAPRFVSMWTSEQINVIDLRRALLRVELTAEELDRTEPVLLAHERAVNVALKRIDREARELLLDWVDACAARGIVHDQDIDEWYGPETRTLVIACLHAMWDDARDAGRDFVIAHAKMVRRLALMMRPDTAQRFRLASRSPVAHMQQRTLHDLQRMNPGYAHLAIALERDDLTDAQREALTAELDLVQRQWGEMMDEAKLLQAEMWGGTSFIAMPARERERILEEYAERYEAILKLRYAFLDEGPNRLSPIIGEAMTEAVVRVVEAERAAVRSPDVHDPDHTLSSTWWEREALLFLPSQITRADFQLYVSLLDYDEDQTAIAAAMFADYLGGLQAIRSDEIEAVIANKVASRWNYPKGGWDDPEAQRIWESEQLWREANAAIVRLNDALLSDFGLLTVQGAQRDASALVRLHRSCRRLAQYESIYLEPMRVYTERSAILVEAVWEADLSTDDRADALAALLPHGPALLAACRAQFEAHREIRRAGWGYLGELMPLRRAGATPGELREHPAWKRSSVAIDACNRARCTLIELNRSVLGQLGHDPGMPGHAALLASYRRLAYPHVYEKPPSFISALKRAQGVADLSGEQGRSLQTLLEASRSAHETICAAICDVYGEPPLQGMLFSPDHEMWNEYQRRNERIQKLEFQRSEVAGRTLARLKEILTEAQQSQLDPPPPEAEAEAGDSGDAP